MDKISFRNRLSIRFVLALAALLLLILSVGLGFLWENQRATIIKQEENRAEFMVSGLLASLKTLMLTGNGTLAREWLDRVAQDPQVLQVQIIRTDGFEAFLDLKTINQVNGFLFGPIFRREALPEQKVSDLPSEAFSSAVEGKTYSFYNDSFDKLTYLLPIAKENACVGCHGYDTSPIRGVLRVTTSLKLAKERITTARNESILLGLITLSMLGLSIFFLVRQLVIKPILAITEITRHIATGNMKARAIVNRHDELGILAISLNKMAEDLNVTINELRKLSAVIENSIDVVFITDSKGNIEYVNPMFEKLTGYSKNEVIGQNPEILSTGETSKIHERIWHTIFEGKTWRGVMKNMKKNGENYWVNCLFSPIKNEAGEITHFLSVQEDITEKIRSEEKIKQLASYDEITGLTNRSQFMELLGGWISYAKKNQQTGVLLLINIDDFKSINSLYGHKAGDEILRGVAKLLRNIFREIDAEYMAKAGRESIISRFGGDEFSIFLPSRNKKDGLNAARQIQNKAENFSFLVMTIQLTFSIGVVLYPEHGATVKELLTRADASLYRAKEKGRNQYHVYRSQDRDLEKIYSKLKWKEQILSALENDRFEPWFQPILDLSNNKIHHYEVLARMRDEKGNILLPEKFIEIAERFGLMGSIYRVITKKTMKIQAESIKSGKSLIFAINLSGINLGDEEIIPFLRSTISETNANPNHFIFEITESAAVRNMDIAVKFMDTLKSMGFQLSLDDFGLGFTSFLYLREMNVDYVKIDGSFIKNLHENKNDQIFVKAVTDIAKGMGIKIIAEFVEKEETLKLIKTYPLDYAQGFFIGRPAPFLSEETA